MALQALPVVRQLAGEQDLAGEQPFRLVGSGLGALDRCPLVPAQIGVERGAQVHEEIPGHVLELFSILSAVGVRGRLPMPAPKLHHELEPRHLDGLLDALAELGVNALDEPARVSVLMTEGPAERVLTHAAPSMRASPRANGSGVMPKSLKKRDGSVTLSSSSMVI